MSAANSNKQTDTSTLRSALHRSFVVNGPKPFLGYRDAVESTSSSSSLTSSSPAGGFKWLTYDEVFQRSYEVSIGLREVLKLAPMAAVGVCLENCPEWLICDFACCFNSNMCVGLMQVWDDDTMSYIIRKADVECIICSPDILPRFLAILANGEDFNIKHIVVLEDNSFDVERDGRKDTTYELISFKRLSEALNGKRVSPMDAINGGLIGTSDKSEIQSMQDPYTLLFTSGTTGRPKGVAVPKYRWKRDAECSPFQGGSPSPAVVSYMSLGHGSDRGICWQACFAGARVGFSQSHGELRSLMRDMEEVKPTFFLGMSYLWGDFFSLFNKELEERVLQQEDILNSIVTSMRNHITPMAAREQDINFESIMQAEECIKLAKELPDWKLFVDSAATLFGLKDSLLYEWNMRLGGSIFTPVTGGGHTSDEVIDWIGKVFTPKGKGGVIQNYNIKNSYGASEFPGITMNGVVSDAIDLVLENKNIDVSLPKSYGEIVVRAKDRNVRFEYYKEPEETAKVFVDGWYKTGDIGEFYVDHGVTKLRIVDRVKNMLELYINGDSKWINPSKLENIYSTCSGVDKICLLGDRNQGCIIAVVQPSWTFVKAALPSEVAALIGAMDAIMQRQTAYSHPAVVQAVLNSLDRAGKRESLQEFEIPFTVILDSDEWTPENGLLTATFKPRRDKLRQKFQKKLEDIYSTKEALSQLGAAASITAPTSSSTSSSSPSPSGHSNTDLMSYIASYISSRSRKVSVEIIFKAAFEFNVNIQSHFGDILLELEQEVGPKSAAKLGFKQGWGGYIEQPSELTLPALTARKKDYFGHFKFQARNEVETARLNDLLDQLRAVITRRLECWDEWSAEAQAIRSTIEKTKEAEKARHDSIVLSEFAKFKDAIKHINAFSSSSTASASSNLSNLFDPLIQAFVNRFYTMEQLSEQANTVKQVKEKTDCLDKMDYLMNTLTNEAPRMGVRVPYQIETGQWFANESTSEQQIKEAALAPVSVFGKAEVKDSITGEIIEHDCFDMGTPRWHCLDAAGLDRSEESHAMATEILFILCDLRSSYPDDEGVDALFQKYHDSHLLNPTNLSIADLVQGVEHCNRKCLWVIEHGHSWQLRGNCNLPRDELLKKKGENPGVWSDFEAPAGFISRSFKNWANRIALGIPDKSIIPDAQCPIAKFPEIVRAAGMLLINNNNYNWITYRDLGVLVDQVAKIIRLKVPRGAFVGIVGYNTIEFSVCDLACALAGCVSVGIHTTYDIKSAHYVMGLSQISLLLCTKDILYQGSNGDFWTLDKVFELDSSPRKLNNLRHVCVMDDVLANLQSSSSPSSSLSSSSSFPSNLGSLVDYIENPILRAEWQDVTLEPPDEQPSTDVSSIFTLLFTSGSTGNPKAVVVSTKSFFKDISDRTYAEPLSTVSYIPLSHSSDRLKLWEFLGNGGRIGFAYFSSSNWLDHETSKKTEAIQGNVESSNGVEPLFRQVQALGPAAMTTPPNIASGLYYMYLSKLKELESSVHSSSALPSTTSADTYSSENVKLARKFIADKFGRNIKFVGCGGGPTAPVVFQFMKDAVGSEVRVIDSYGATEIGAICQDWRPMCRESTKFVRFRVVDIITRERHMKKGEIGEAWVNSRSISSGYFQDPVQTAANFISELDPSGAPKLDCNGVPIVWYRTGDLVKIVEEAPLRSLPDFDEYWEPKIKILGRLASAVRLSSGKTVSPDVLEGIFSASHLLSNIYIHGRSDCEHLVAIVSVPFEYRGRDKESLTALVLAEIQKVSQLKENDLSEAETPKRVHIDLSDWSIENGLLNGSMKKNRKEFALRFASVLNTLLKGV